MTTPTDVRADRRAAYTLFLLCLVAVLNYIDRYLPSILLESIKADLKVSDTLMGLLTGTAFSVCYVVAGFPIARMADRAQRRSIIAVCIGVWSAMTALSGMATTFLHLAIARAGVAIGESGAVPASQSLISDLFPADRRATAIGIMMAAGSAGIGFALFLGGWLNETFSWRTAFFVVGLPGLALAFLVRLTVREPLRETRGGQAEQPPFRVIFANLWRVRSYRLILLVALMTSFASYGMIAWAPAYVMRVHGLSVGEAGLWLGVGTLIGTAGGNALAGVISDRLGSRDVRWYAWVAGLGTLAATPFGVLFALSGSAAAAIVFYTLVQLLKSLWYAPVYGMALTLAPSGSRATVSAILTAVVNLGLGFGPLAIGMMNDALAGALGAQGIRYSLLIAMAGLAAAGLTALRLSRHYPHDLKMAT